MQNLAPFMSNGHFYGHQWKKNLNLQVLDKHYWTKAIIYFLCSYICLEEVQTGKLPSESLFRSQTDRLFFIEKNQVKCKVAKHSKRNFSKVTSKQKLPISWQYITVTIVPRLLINPLILADLTNSIHITDTHDHKTLPLSH